MKKIMIASVLATLSGLSSVSVSAAEKHETYVFANAGETRTSLGGDLVINNLGLGLGVGIKISRQVGAEFSYTNLGHEGDVRSDAYAASLVGRYPVAPGLVARAKIGIANSGLYVKQDDAQIGTRGVDAVMGLGAEFKIDRNFSLVGEFERFNNVGASSDSLGARLNAERVSVGVQYKF